ncbi:MAG: DsrE family protein [Betaproteobacteria bacterium]|nr:DsrE family protein [Betaproteobacteria bacterium]
MLQSTKTRLCVAASAAVCALALGFAPSARADYVKPTIHHAPFGTVRMVVPITSPDPGVWAFKLNNIANSENGIKAWKGKLEAHIVLYGPGLKLLEEPMDPELQTKVDQLRREGVRFDICNNTLKGMNLDWHTLHGVRESDIVPAGFLEVAWLADHGWAVDPMN